MKWLMFGVELFLLWIFYNTTLLVPGDYDLLRFIFIAVAAALSLLCAYVSGTRFKSAFSGEYKANWEVISTPPLVIWIFVTAIIIFSVLRFLLIYKWSRG
jgi:hypothetical protein